MELTHRFTVPAGVDDTWRLLNDLEQVAPCFPGASLTSVDGEEFAGTVKVKLGPISMEYKGTGSFTERDEDQHRAVIDAKGKDKRGNGTANATVTARLSPDGDGTAVEVDTDLAITGKPAQFGRGVIEDVSDKLLDQFVACLSEKLGAPVAESQGAHADTSPASQQTVSGEASPAGTTQAGPMDAGSLSSVSGETESTQSGTTQGRTTQGRTTQAGAAGSSARPQPLGDSDNSLDLGATVIPVIAKRYAPQIAGVVAAVIIIGWFRRRRRKKARTAGD